MAEKPKAYFQTDVPSDDRFISLDKPTQQEFTNLFDSLRFGAETADSAKTNRHGLIKVATKTLKNARSNTDASGFTVGVVPDQLPEVVAAADSVLTVTADNTLERTVYTISDAALVTLINSSVNTSVGAWTAFNAFGSGSPQLGSGWQALAGTTPKYRQLAGKLVEVNALLTRPGSSSLTMLYMGASLAPLDEIRETCNMYNSVTSSILPVIVAIETAGGITINGASGSGPTIIYSIHLIYTKA